MNTILNQSPPRSVFSGTFILPVILLLCSAGCGQDRIESGTTLRIAVATNFKPAFEQLTALYLSQNPSTTISSHYASSGLLYAQISNGAPYDIFLSADYMRAQIIKTQQNTDVGFFTYAYGQLALWVPDIERPDFNWLHAHPGTIAIANPELAPYGFAARTCLEKHKVLTSEHQLVLGSSVAQTFHFVASGAAKAGIVAKSQVLDFGVSDKYYRLLSPDCYAPIQQQVVSMDAPPQKAKTVQAFMDFLKSRAAQSLIENAGYLPGHFDA